MTQVKHLQYSDAQAALNSISNNATVQSISQGKVRKKELGHRSFRTDTR